jgi:NTP pyrophosphatase (non-canonical NTP hydrolase)
VAMSKGVPTTDLLMLRRMGKFLEELGELQAVAARVIIQGIDEVDPGSGVVNRERLEKEIADVMAQCLTTIDTLSLDEDAIHVRVNEKMRQKAEWESLFLEG